MSKPRRSAPEMAIAPPYLNPQKQFASRMVDIPEWAADYYLAVQVNLDDGWFCGGLQLI